MSIQSSIFLKSLVIAGMRVLASACALVLTLLVARRSVHDLGVFRTLFAYFIICEGLPLLGMQTYLVREIAVRPEKIKQYGLHALVFSLGIGLLGAAVLCAVTLSGGYSATVGQGLYVVAAGLPAMAASSVGYSVLIALGKATSVGVIQGIETIVRTGIGIAFVFLGWGIIPVIIVMVVARWLVLFGYWKLVQPALGSFSWRWDRRFFLEFVRHVPAFAGITLMATVVRFAPQTMLPWMLSDAAAGQFAAAYIFIDMVLLVPTAFMTNLGPVFARKANESVEALLEACRQGIKTMSLGVVPMAAITMAVARPLFQTIFPGNAAYAMSARVLEIIIWVCALQVVDLVLSIATIARGKQHIDFFTQMTGAAALVILLAVLVPVHGVLGAAIALLSSVTVLVCARMILARRQLQGINLFDLLWRPALAAAVAIAVAKAAAPYHWIAAAIAAVVAYVVTLVAIGALNVAEREGTVRFLQTGKA
jgi:O-antigen/teichoic acid export membrane protein